MSPTDRLHDNSYSTQNEKLVGWVLESPGRGTLSLIVSCLFTTFLCTWAIIHPRVIRHAGRRHLHKFAIFLKTIIAPEFLAVEGLQEWSQARKIVKQCKHHTNGELSLVQAFYIGMLALRYRTERGERVIWPNQYQWLLEQQLIGWETHHHAWGLSKGNIRDKSNADITVRIFALLQVAWFVAQSIMRAAHDLPLSQLESMTLSYVPLFAVTVFFWWEKPKDVLTPSVVDLPVMSAEQKVIFENLSIDSAFDDEHTQEQDSWGMTWKLTTRLFEKEAKDKAFEEIAQQMNLEAIEEDISRSERALGPKESEGGTSTTNTPIKKAATENVSLESTLREMEPSVRRTFTGYTLTSEKSQQATNEMTDVFCIEPKSIRRSLRRATTGFLTSHTTGLTEAQKADRIIPQYPSEIVLAYWDPEVYHSKIWPITCLFGSSFGALHLISWYTVFPSLVETWLWRAAAITSIVSMLIFMHFEKVVLRWGGPLTLLSIISPAVYLVSRIVMIGGVIAAFRAMDQRIYETYVVSSYWIHLV